jgi:phenylpropionate dioxygenase-like ring-hydroxylating dioxygenase large terminal subunit
MQSLRARDGHLVDHWYIACLSDELRAGRPIQRVLYEQPLVLFRDAQGKPACLPDRCLHRATLLSEGRVENGRLSCPYHGWIYDAQGNVVEIPSEGEGAPRSKLCLKPLPAVEQDGCVWVWTGEGEPASAAPPWRFPEYDNPAWTRYFMITDFDNEVTHLAENFMDVPHTIFVHRGWFRNPRKQRVPMKLEVGDGSVLVTYRQPNDSIGFSSRILNPEGAPMVHTDRFIFPNLTRVDYLFGRTSGFIINSQITPVASLKSRVYTYIAYRIGRVGGLIKPFMRFYTRQVIEQDVEIMANQGRSFRFEPEPRFRSTDADEIHIAIERLRELGAQGDPGVMTYRREKEKEFWI